MNQVFPAVPTEGVLLPGFEIDLARGVLLTATGVHVDLRPRSFAVLRLLAENRGRLVTKDELLATVWDDAVVTEDSLTQCIADIRRTIGDDDRKIVRTIPRRGYLLAAQGIGMSASTPIRESGAPAEGNRAVQRSLSTAVLPRRHLLVAFAFVAGTLGLAAAFLWNKQNPDHRVAEGPSVAVMPFENHTGDQGNDALADRLTEEIVTALSRFKELRVLARNTTASYRGRQISPIEVGQSLHVDYVITGAARTSDGHMVVPVHLADARGGEQVFAATYDRSEMPSEPSFHEQLALRAAARLGNWTGVIASNEARRSRTKLSTELTSYECVAHAHTLVAFDRTAMQRARECLDITLKRDPKDATAWAGLANTLTVQRWYGVGLDPPQSIDIDKRAYLADMAIDAAQNAVFFAPSDPFVRMAAARAYYAACRRDMLQIEAERALTLNPNDPDTLAQLGNFLGYSGFWDLGTPMAERAIALSGPIPQRWWWWVVAKNRWLHGDHGSTLAALEKSFMEQHWLSHLHMSYMLPSVGRFDEAKTHIATLLRLKPGFTIREADAYYRMWCFEPEFRAKMVEGLRLAGLPE